MKTLLTCIGNELDGHSYTQLNEASQREFGVCLLAGPQIHDRLYFLLVETETEQLLASGFLKPIAPVICNQETFSFLNIGGTSSERALRCCWKTHQPTMHIAMSRFQTLAKELQQQTLPLVICHADLHPANLIHDPSGHVWVIDWDMVMLAPKESDFLFVGDPPADGSVGAALPAFWQGYGPTVIDRVALTYYRYER